MINQNRYVYYRKIKINYNESKAVPRSDTIATECRLMEFSEMKYYVALIRQIKKTNSC